MPDRPARILVLTNMYPPQHLGGYELWCQEVVRRWRRRHDVLVLTSDVWFRPAPEEEEGVERRLGLYWAGHRFLKPPLHERWRLERRNHRALREVLASFRPDVVSVWHMGGMSLGLLTTLSRGGYPLVLVVHDEWLSYAQRADSWLEGFARRPVLRRLARLSGLPVALDVRVSAYCVVSEFIRRRIPDSWPPAEVAVVPSGLDLSLFCPRASPPPWRWQILYVGRVEPRKGVHVAVQALAHLPSGARLDILGPVDEDYLRELRALAVEGGARDRVRFGLATRAELPARYAQADVVVFPVTWDEPWGLVPLEAMAVGTPVVATATGGSAEFLVDGKNAIVVPRGDPAALAAAVRRLSGDAALRRHLAACGRRTAERYEAGRLAAELEAVHLRASGVL